MSDEKKRRLKTPQAPEAPSGYRQTRRGSKSAKQAKKAEKQHKMVSAFDKMGRGVRNVVWVIAWGLAIVGLSALVLLLIANAVNTVVRWNARRAAESTTAASLQEKKARENVLVIGVEGDRAVGFLALRVDGKGKQVYGIAIPDGAFLDVPGQGFERVGESYAGGADVSLAAISNYLTVPFRSYVVVPAAAYKDALTRQTVNGLFETSQGSNMTSDALADLSKTVDKFDPDNVAIVPMPVKPIKLGDQTYFEPQRKEVADLLKQWWNVDPSDQQRAVRVIVYNGSGIPGIAGEAAQQLIRAGLRVVDTKNADRFDYKTTQIVVRRGDESRGKPVREALGVGEIKLDPSSSDVTDVIVIIGKDYRPPKADTQKGTK